MKSQVTDLKATEGSLKISNNRVAELEIMVAKLTEEVEVRPVLIFTFPAFMAVRILSVPVMCSVRSFLLFFFFFLVQYLCF